MVNRGSPSRRFVALLVVAAALAIGAYVIVSGDAAGPTAPPAQEAASSDAHTQPGLTGRGSETSLPDDALALPEPLPVLAATRAPVVGLCVDADGRPIARAEVLALAPHAVARWYEDATVARTTSDAKGRFRFEPEALPSALESVRLLAWHAQDEQSTERPLVVALPPDREQILELSASRTVTGRVALEQGVPASTIRVRALSDHFPEHPATRIVPVDAEGRFAVPGCRRFVHVQATTPGRQASDTVLVMLGSDPRWEPTLVLGPPGTKARVRLVDDEGAPLPRGVQALAGTAGTLLVGCTVGEDGMIEADDVDPTRPLRVSVPDQRGERMDRWLLGTYADVPADELGSTPPWTLTIGRSLSVTVRLLDAGGAPMPQTRLMLQGGTEQEVARTGGRTAMPGTTDDRGECVFSRSFALRPGSYTLTSAGGAHVLWSGELRKPHELVEVAWAGPERSIVPFDCFGADGQPLRHAWIEIEARHIDTGPERSASSRVGRDAMGPDGSVRLLVQAHPLQANQRISYQPKLDGRELATGSYDLTPPQAGTPGRFQLRYGAYGSLTLELRRGDHPLQEAHAFLRGDTGLLVRAPEPSDDEGFVHFGVVPAGEWRVEVRSGSSSTFLRGPIDIVADVAATRTIDIARSR